MCRREGMKLFFKGSRCLTEKCAFERRGYPPGQHGQSGKRTKATDYSTQLREKQKVKRIYSLLERQFRGYFRGARREKGCTRRAPVQEGGKKLKYFFLNIFFSNPPPKHKKRILAGNT